MSTEAIPQGATVGFVGLGHMGGPMAANLAAAGFDVRGYDPLEPARAAAAAAGVTVVDSVAQAAHGAAAVLTSLPSGALLLKVYRGEEGILVNAIPGTLLIDTSTCDVDEARQASSEASDAGMLALDAPISGGVVGATAGTLAFMVGGSPEAFERGATIFDVLGARAVLCGGSGAGQAVKLCNNMLLAIHQVGVAEAFALAQNLGVEPQAFYDVASVATGACWALNTNCPVPGPVPTSPSNRDYEPGFTVSLMNKDLGLALAAVERSGTHAELGRHAQAIFTAAGEAGDADRDFSVVYRGIAERSGLSEPAPTT
jgi:3-hydroxyisobutyrate dehydrogenase